jgi:hypothetical protein
VFVKCVSHCREEIDDWIIAGTHVPVDIQPVETILFQIVDCLVRLVFDSRWTVPF